MKKLTHEEFIEKVTKLNEHVANGEIEILSQYINQRTKIKCKCAIHNTIWERSVQSLYENSGCEDCKYELSGRKRRFSHEEFVEKIKVLNDEIIVLGHYTTMNKSIEFQCKFGHIWTAKPYSIINGHQCPYCAGQKPIIGNNDLWTTRPDVASLLKNRDDGYGLMEFSQRKVIFICPTCGNEIIKSVQRVSIDGLVCQRCSDGVSYPNKFARAFLNQLLGNNFKCEYQPDWAKPYYYDNYFEYGNKKYILEMDGSFHYISRQLTKQSLDERKRIDALKDKLAEQHNIRVIRIECIKSNCNYIKNNILQSELSLVFNLSKINWDLCDQMAQRSLVKDVCNLYMNGIKDLHKIAEILHISKSTVYVYLVRGSKFGWCDYDGKNAHYLKISIPIIVLDENNNAIHKFDSISACKEEMKKMYGYSFDRNTLKKACEYSISYHGFNFKYAY